MIIHSFNQSNSAKSKSKIFTWVILLVFVLSTFTSVSADTSSSDDQVIQLNNETLVDQNSKLGQTSSYEISKIVDPEVVYTEQNIQSTNRHYSTETTSTIHARDQTVSYQDVGLHLAKDKKESYSLGLTAPMVNFDQLLDNTNWEIGETLPIEWTFVTCNEVGVKLFLGASQQLSVTRPATDLSYNVDLTGYIAANNYRVILECLDESRNILTDISSGIFGIGLSITITSPVSGDEWPQTSTQTIEWTTTGIPNDETVTIYWTQGGYPGVIDGTQNDGSFTWTSIPEFIEGTDIQIRMTYWNSVWDYSDNFEVKPAITVITPASTDVWIMRSIVTVEWETSGIGEFINAGNQGDPIGIELCYGTAVCNTYTEGVPIVQSTLNTGIIDVQIPDGLPRGTNWYFRVSAIGFTADSEMFEIRPRFVVQNALQDVSLVKSSYYTLDWQIFAHPLDYSNIVVQLRKNGVWITNLAYNIENNGSLTFKIETNLQTGNDYQIGFRYLDQSDYYVDDQTFSIIDPSFSFTSIDTNTEWEIGETQTISWDFDGSATDFSMVTLKIFNDGHPIYQATTINNGSYSFILDNNFQIGTKYSVELSSTNSVILISNISPEFPIGTPLLLVTSIENTDGFVMNSDLVLTNTYQITWTFDGSNELYPEVIITLHQFSDTGFSYPLINCENSGLCSFTIPSALPEGDDYYIKIRMLNNWEIYGNSNLLVVRPPELYLSPSDDEYIISLAYTLNWDIEASPNQFLIRTLYLKHADGTNLLLSECEENYKCDFILPDVSDKEGYYFQFSTGGVSEESNSFDIRLPLINFDEQTPTILVTGNNYLIQWEFEGNSDFYSTVYLYIHGGYENIQFGEFVNNGSATITIPIDLRISYEYQIVILVDPFDSHDALTVQFTTPTIDIISPSLDILLYQDECTDIIWNFNGNQDLYIDVSIYLYFETESDVISASTANDGEFEWCISGSVIPRADYIISINVLDGPNAIEDVSEGFIVQIKQDVTTETSTLIKTNTQTSVGSLASKDDTTSSNDEKNGGVPLPINLLNILFGILIFYSFKRQVRSKNKR